MIKSKKETQVGNIKFLYFLLVLSITILSLLSITLGVADITVGETFEILISKFTGADISPHISGAQQTIIMQLRVPRILMALLTGINLSVTGAVYQAIFKNSMADPYMLGISSGASLGAGIGFVLGGFTPIYAFLGALVANILVIALSGAKGKVSTMRLLLSGIAINYFFSSVLSILRVYSNDQKLTLFAWGMGSLSAASYTRVWILAGITFPTLIVLFFYRKELNLLLMGEDVARSLGVDVGRVRKVLLGISTLLIATTVAFTGTIGFVGLIIPHVVRMIFGSNYRVTLPMSGLFGMIFLLMCDNISRGLLSSGEIPIGIITSVFGAPYFMYLIYKDRKREAQ
ncbi:MAG: FecCD family ABC transporter permease [Cellulosilyticaceae bacterium]